MRISNCVGMCCEISSQDRVKVISIFSILFCIASTILGCIDWVLDNSRFSQTNTTNVSITCDITLQADCNLTTTDNIKGAADNQIRLRVLLTIFQLVIDLPASVLLLIGAKLRIKLLLIPWMLIMAVKMLGYVIGVCIWVQFVLVQVLDENFGFGMKHYSKLTNDTNEQHYSIFSGSVVDSVIHKRYFQNQDFSVLEL